MKREKRFQIFAHAVLVLLSVFALLPMLLMVMSSITDNDTLISEGYSFIPSKFSFYAYEYIFKTGNSVLRAYGVSILCTDNYYFIGLCHIQERYAGARTDHFFCNFFNAV